MFDIILAIAFGCLAWGSWHEYTTKPDKYAKYSSFAKKAVVVGSGLLAVIFLCSGLFGGHSKKQPAAYYKLGTPISEDGEIAAVLVDGDTEATLKRVKRQGDLVMLMPDNKNYDPIILDGKNPGRIIGKAVHVSWNIK